MYLEFIREKQLMASPGGPHVPRNLSTIAIRGSYCQTWEGVSFFILHTFWSGTLCIFMNAAGVRIVVLAHTKIRCWDWLVSVVLAAAYCTFHIFWFWCLARVFPNRTWRWRVLVLLILVHVLLTWVVLSGFSRLRNLMCARKATAINECSRD